MTDDTIALAFDDPHRRGKVVGRRALDSGSKWVLATTWYLHRDDDDTETPLDADAALALLYQALEQRT
jgi:hypothetical protein